MPIRNVVITAQDGMHARPAAELARLALEHGDTVTLTTAAGSTVDLSSVLAVMDLALERGDEVAIETPASPDGDDVLDAMAAILAPRS